MSEIEKDELVEDETLEEEVDSEVTENEEEDLDNQLLEDNHDVVVDIKLSEENLDLLKQFIRNMTVIFPELIMRDILMAELYLYLKEV